jgi:hypothetical protein
MSSANWGGIGGGGFIIPGCNPIFLLRLESMMRNVVAYLTNEQLLVSN